jgi:hypothetical protein
MIEAMPAKIEIPLDLPEIRSWIDTTNAACTPKPMING